MRGGLAAALLCVVGLWPGLAVADAPRTAPLPIPSPAAPLAEAPEGVPVPAPRPDEDAAVSGADAPAAAPEPPVAPPPSAAEPAAPKVPEESEALSPYAVATAPLPPPRPGVAGSTLLGIFSLTTGRTALLRFPSGEITRLSVGDMVDGWQVSSITSDQLMLTRSGRNRTFLLMGN